MPSELNMTIFSKRLKEARTDKNMTQKELAEKTGVSSVMISAYESKNTSSGKNPALNNIYAIATALGVSIDWLCGLPVFRKNNTAKKYKIKSIVTHYENDIEDLLEHMSNTGFELVSSEITIGETYTYCFVGIFTKEE